MELQIPGTPPGRRRRKGLFLALASACVIFSVAVIGHTHPPFPAPKIRRRDEAADGGLGAPIAAVEAHRNPAAAWPLWFGVAILAVGALAALSFIRRSEDPHHSHLK